jgi:hypothetical protein
MILQVDATETRTENDSNESDPNNASIPKTLLDDRAASRPPLPRRTEALVSVSESLDLDSLVTTLMPYGMIHHEDETASHVVQHD